jgi:hypothetical protein
VDIRIKVETKVDPNAGRQLAREIKKNAKRKLGVDVKVDERELQRIIKRAFS